MFAGIFACFISFTTINGKIVEGCSIAQSEYPLLHKSDADKNDLFCYIIHELAHGSSNRNNKVTINESIPTVSKNTIINGTNLNKNKRTNGKRNFSTSSRGTKYSVNLPFHGSIVKIDFESYDVMKSFVLKYNDSDLHSS